MNSKLLIEEKSQATAFSLEEKTKRIFLSAEFSYYNLKYLGREIFPFFNFLGMMHIYFYTFLFQLHNIQKEEIKVF